GLLLPVAQQVWRHERARGQAAQGAGVREHAVEEAAGRAAVRERRHQGCSAKKVVTAPARRTLVRHLVDRGLSERRALAMVRMSASALRYVPRPDGNVELRERIAWAERLDHLGQRSMTNRPTLISGTQRQLSARSGRSG